MKLICSKSDLLKSVNIASKAVSSKTTLPILECFLIEAFKGVIKMTANDMELGIETIVQGKILEEGVIAIEAKIFSEIIRRLPDADIMIDTNADNQVMITCEKAKFNLIGRPGDEFSVLPHIEKDRYISMSEFALKEIVKQTIFSISDSDTNIILTGELFEVKGNQFKVVSLDGHRISIRRIELKDSYDDVKMIIPAKTLNDLTKILSGEAEAEIRIYFTRNHLLFEFGNTRVVSRIIEGEYINIAQILSNDYQTKVHVNRRELLECIERSTLLVKEGDKRPIIIDVKDGDMELKINSSIGSMNEDIAIEKEGKDLMIAFNPKFLIDAIRVIDDEEIDIYMMNAKSPCIIKDADESYIYLILPVNFNPTEL